MFVFCIESSHSRGMGHLYRSLTLAEELRHRGRDIHFLVNDHETTLNILRSRGFEITIYDLEAPDGSWENAFTETAGRPEVWVDDRLDTTLAHTEAVIRAGARLVTFDDRGDGAELADINIGALVFDEIDRLKGREVKSGIEYMILNPEIEGYRRARKTVRSILVTLGGADTHGVTVHVANWLQSKPFNVTVVTGPAFHHREELNAVLSKPALASIEHLTGVPSMAQEMSRHDLAITGGGLTPFEAAASGLPSIVIANELFEIPVGRALERLGFSRFGGHHRSLDLDTLSLDLPIEIMSQTALRRTDLDGSRRIADLLEALLR
ncbi:PseG/SpsG family protein [Rhizobium binxianense]|uniref:PseG/SpsG family protein n=1 Tax=Rhizobium binxianense TaxID=3024242 RepID=UPI00235FA947|nr:glycosyl transferase [Rhizobium sp. MC62]MDC9808234.1 glycosyl transferase [Rhizobium sp. MC62]